MAHIKQNDSRCIPAMQKIGCFVRSCGLIAELRTGRDLTAEQINALWAWGKEARRIDENDNVKDSASIATRALRMLGDGGRFVEVGTFKDGVATYYPSVRGTGFARADALIQKIRQGGQSVTHFRVVDARGNLIEDPHEPPIQPRGIFYTILYAYIPGKGEA